MLYLSVVSLTMFILPLVSIVVDHFLHPDTSVFILAGTWFVFWGVGVRLALAGGRQVMQPEFTAREIFHMESSEALPLVRELGISNLATGLVGLLSLFFSSFVLPVAISAGIFYGVAGFQHLMESNRSRNENIAMVSDIFLFLVLGCFVAGNLLT